MKEENKEDHARVRNRIDKLESNIEELKKFRWQFGAILAAAIIIIGMIPTATSLLTHPSTQVTIEEAK
jgi:hypothetical protein